MPDGNRPGVCGGGHIGVDADPGSQAACGQGHTEDGEPTIDRAAAVGRCISNLTTYWHSLTQWPHLEKECTTNRANPNLTREDNRTTLLVCRGV